MESQKQKIDSAQEKISAAMLKFQRGYAGITPTLKSLEKTEIELSDIHKTLNDQLNVFLGKGEISFNVLTELHDCGTMIGFLHGAQSALIATKRR